MARLVELGITLAAGLVSGAILALSTRAIYVRERNRQNKASRGKSRDAAVVGADGKRKYVKQNCEVETMLESKKLVNPSAQSRANGQGQEEKGVLIPHHSQPAELSECFLMIHHVAKNRNVGSLLRTATAFGCTAVICVGLRKVSQLNFFGAHGSEKRIKVMCFLYMDEAIQFLQDRAKSQGRKRCHIVGLEITPDAKLIHKPSTFEAFKTSSGSDGTAVTKPDNFCLIPGNEGIGLTEKDREFCDYCMIIPQFGSATASLNVSSACAIALYQFAVAAGFVEASREGEKYVVSSQASAQAVQQCQGLSRTDIAKYEQEKVKRRIAENGVAADEEDEDGSTGFASL